MHECMRRYVRTQDVWILSVLSQHNIMVRSTPLLACLQVLDSILAASDKPLEALAELTVPSDEDRMQWKS